MIATPPAFPARTRVGVVAVNPAVDITYYIPSISVGKSHRASQMFQRAGGKGLNVCHVLAALQQHCLLIGVSGGRQGEWLRDQVCSSFIGSIWVRQEAETRRSISIVDAEGQSTVINETGAELSTAVWREVYSAVADHLPQLRVLVLTGSLPPGAPEDAYAQLIALAHRAQIPVILDASGSALRAGLAARPDVVKPNWDEALQLIDAPEDTDPARVVAQLQDLGATNVILSMGHLGVVASNGAPWPYPNPTQNVAHPAESLLQVQGPRLHGNPTGAGDALVAGIAQGYMSGLDWEQSLKAAVGLGAAAVSSQVAGEVDLDLVASMQPQINVQPWRATAGGGLSWH